MSRIFKPISDIRKEKRRAKIVTRARIGLVVVSLILLFYVLISYSGHWLVRSLQAYFQSEALPRHNPGGLGGPGGPGSRL